MSDDVISRAKETRRRIKDLDVNIDYSTYYRERCGDLMEALDKFSKAEIEKDNDLMTQNAQKIEQKFSELVICGGIKQGQSMFKKYDDLVQSYTYLVKTKDNLKEELKEINEKINALEIKNNESFENNRKLVIIIDKVVGILQKLGIKLDEGYNRLSG